MSFRTEGDISFTTGVGTCRLGQKDRDIFVTPNVSPPPLEGHHNEQTRATVLKRQCRRQSGGCPNFALAPLLPQCRQWSAPSAPTVCRGGGGGDPTPAPVLKRQCRRQSVGGGGEGCKDQNNCNSPTGNSGLLSPGTVSLKL